MKFIKLLLITWSLSANAGLPPATLSGQSSATKPTTFTTQVPYNQATQIAGTQSLIETGNENILKNPSFEASTLSGWTCTTGTCTVETTVFSSGKQSVKIVPSANVFDFGQSVNTSANIQKQGVVGIVYNFPATCQTAIINSKIDGATQTSVPSSSLIYDGSFHSIEVPIIFGSTSAGIQVFAGSTCTGNIYLDAAYVKQGIGFQNLMLDNTYSAQVTTTSGAIASQSKTFIASCTAANGTVCTFTAGIFTTAPNCTATISPLGAYGLGLTVTSSGFTLYSFQTNTTSAQASVQATVTCQKSGNDYLASSSNVYTQASANYSRRAYTPTFTGFGTVSSVDCYESREGEFNDIDCKFTSGTSTAVEARVSLPNSNVSSSAIASIRGAGGVGIINQATASSYYPLIEQSVGYLTFGIQTAAASGLNKLTGSNFLASGQIFHFTARVPIAGWSNSAQIVGSFAGVPTVPSYNGAIDTFSFTFGTTNGTTACSASPCSYLDQIGSQVSSITRSATGNYTINFARTYTKLKCPSVTVQRGAANAAIQESASALTCSSCNSLSLNAEIPSSGAYADVFGTIQCQGTY